MAHDTIIPPEPAVDAYLTHLDRAGWGRSFSEEVRYTVAYTALQLGLDPVLRELWVTDEDEVCITVAGLAKMAYRLGIQDGFTPEPIHEAREVDDVAVWRGILHIKGASQPIVEIAQAGGREEKNPVAREYPNETARTKARGRCLKAAMGIGLPMWEDLQGGRRKTERLEREPRETPRAEGEVRKRRGAAPAFASADALERFRGLADGAGMDAHGQLDLLRQEARELHRSFETRRKGAGYDLGRVPRIVVSAAIAKLEKENRSKERRYHAATS